MDWACKGVMTMAAVALVLALARRCGGTAAGLVAGLPTTTAPALGWMAHEHGVRFAVDAAAATVAACALMAAFALAYAHASTRHPTRGVAMAVGAAAALALGGPVSAAGRGLLPALALALGCFAVALLAWPAADAGGCGDRDAGDRRSVVWPAAMAGGLSLGLAWGGPQIGTLGAGLLASLPIVSVTVAAAQHASAGPAAARRFLFGAVAGLLGRVAFGVVFASTVGPCGLAPALAWATVAAVAANLMCAGACRVIATAGPNAARRARRGGGPMACR